MLPSYGAAKGGIVQLTKAMAEELALHYIQVNAIAPGWIATEMTALTRVSPGYAEFSKMILAHTPAVRWGEADEVAGAAVFLASSAADFITGVTMQLTADIQLWPPRASVRQSSISSIARRWEGGIRSRNRAR